MGIDKNSGKGSRSLKTTTDRPSIIKKEHVRRKLKGSFGSPLCFLQSRFSPPPLWEPACWLPQGRICQTCFSRHFSILISRIRHFLILPATVIGNSSTHVK